MDASVVLPPFPDIITVALERMDRSVAELSNVDVKNSGVSTSQKLLERPVAYEFYHQLRVLQDTQSPFLAGVVIQGEVDKRYQHFPGLNAVPDFLVHQPNSNQQNLAVIEIKVGWNWRRICKDLNKMLRFRKKLNYQNLIEIVIGRPSTRDIENLGILACTHQQPENEITFIYFDVELWTGRCLPIFFDGKTVRCCHSS